MTPEKLILEIYRELPVNRRSAGEVWNKLEEEYYQGGPSIVSRALAKRLPQEISAAQIETTVRTLAPLVDVIDVVDARGFDPTNLTDFDMRFVGKFMGPLMTPQPCDAVKELEGLLVRLLRARGTVERWDEENPF